MERSLNLVDCYVITTYRAKCTCKHSLRNVYTSVREPPVGRMSFRPRGNVRRQRRVDSDGDDDDDVDEIAKRLNKAKVAPRPVAPSKPVVSKKLSLDDEDGEEIFKKKKKRPKARGVSTSALNDEQNGAGKRSASYSDAALYDLKSQTPKMPSGFAEKSKAATEGPCPQHRTPANLPEHNALAVLKML